MAGSLYGQFNSPLAAATSQYSQEAVQNADQAIKPQYQSALKEANQSASNRGLLNSGINLENQNGITKDYLDQLAGTAASASMQGAQQNWQSGQAEAQRTFEEKMQGQALAQQKAEFDAEQQAQQQAMWANLISGAARGGAGVIGGVLGSLSQPKASAPTSAPTTIPISSQTNTEFSY